MDKSSLTAELAGALRGIGFRVGAIDLDITSTGLHKAFGVPGDLGEIAINLFVAWVTFCHGHLAVLMSSAFSNSCSTDSTIMF